MAKNFRFGINLFLGFALLLGKAGVATADGEPPRGKLMLTQCRQFVEQHPQAHHTATTFGIWEGYHLIPKIGVVVNPQLHAYVKKLRGPTLVNGHVQQNKVSFKVQEQTGFMITTADNSSDAADLLGHIKGLARSFKEHYWSWRLARPLSCIYAGWALCFLASAYPDIDRALLVVGNLAFLSFIADLFTFWQAKEWQNNLEILETSLRSIIHQKQVPGWESMQTLVVLENSTQGEVVADFLQRLGLVAMDEQDWQDHAARGALP